MLKATTFLAMAKAGAAQYDIGIAQIDPIGHSQTATFLIKSTADDAKYLLRIHVPISESEDNFLYSKPAIESELLWLEALRRDTDLCVQVPIRNSEGDLISKLSGRRPDPIHCTLLKWIEGEIPIQPQRAPAMARSFGELAALLHDHASQWEIPENFSRPTDDWEFFTKSLNGLRDAVDMELIPEDCFLIFEETSLKIRETFEEMKRRDLPFGLIHADLNEGNILYQDERARPIDFAACGFGYHLQDIGGALLHLHGEARKNFCIGYQSVRPLPQD